MKKIINNAIPFVVIILIPFLFIGIISYFLSLINNEDVYSLMSKMLFAPKLIVFILYVILGIYFAYVAGIKLESKITWHRISVPAAFTIASLLGIILIFPLSYSNLLNNLMNFKLGMMNPIGYIYTGICIYKASVSWFDYRKK